jgi:hypothetical protein
MTPPESGMEANATPPTRTAPTTPGTIQPPANLRRVSITLHLSGKRRRVEPAHRSTLRGIGPNGWKPEPTAKKALAAHEPVTACSHAACGGPAAWTDRRY